MTERLRKEFGRYGCIIEERSIDCEYEEKKQVLFNFTDIPNYFEIVPVEESDNVWLDIADHNGRHVPLEHRSVYSNYRGEKVIFTLLRPLILGYQGQNSFGRELANLIGLYYSDRLYRWSDFSHDFEHRNDYMLCFTPNIGFSTQGYYYKACRENEFSAVFFGQQCPYGMRYEDSPLPEGKTGVMRAGECQHCLYHLREDNTNCWTVCRISPLLK